MKCRKMNSVRLALGLLYLLGSGSAALADGEAVGNVTVLQNLSDRSLVVAYQTSSADHRVERFKHQPKLVANDCLTLEPNHFPTIGGGMALRNQCTYRVAVSYCVTGDDGKDQLCDEVGDRKIETHWIEPRAKLKLQLAADDAPELRWIACRQGESVMMASLTAQGTYGECLGVDAASPPSTGAANLAVLP
jgi:hypothetical protein